jgi:translation initiation factor 2B subunit (eIF-2B alpha/beta/delta family)
MNLFEKILMGLIILLMLILTGGFIYLDNMSNNYNKTKRELKITLDKLEKEKIKCQQDIDFCQKQMNIELTKKEIEIKTKKELINKIEKEKEDYEILASNKRKNNDINTSDCGCKFDGIGWVFK